MSSTKLKRNNISPINLHELDKYFDSAAVAVYYDKSDDGEDIFPDEPVDVRLVYETDKENYNGSAKNNEIDDIRYSPWFYQFYFKSRKIGLQPIASPSLLNYVVKGSPFDIGEIIEGYYLTLSKLYPKVKEADQSISDIMQHFPQMGNNEIKGNLLKLYEFAKGGEFSELSSFVNAGVYLVSFASILDDISEEDIRDTIKTGINIWLENNDLDDISKSRFKAIKGMIDREVADIYEYAESAIAKKDEKEHKLEEDQLLELFSTDFRKFCVNICPQGFSVQSSFGITFYMENPILDKVSTEQIGNLVFGMTVGDTVALEGLLNERYQSLRNKNLFAQERTFWETLYGCMSDFKSNPSAGHIQMRKILQPRIEQILFQS